MLHHCFSLVVYFIHSIRSMYMSIPISQFIPSRSPWTSCLQSLCDSPSELPGEVGAVGTVPRARSASEGSDSKESACNAGDPGSVRGEDPLEKGMATTPEFLPGEFHGQRSLAGYSPWGHKELDMIE